MHQDNIKLMFIERQGLSDNTGNIYKGRVQRVLPGMQAAFVDIGLKQAAFLYVNDILADNLKEIESLFSENDEESFDEATESNDNGAGPKSKANITDLISEGQEMLVQVAKSSLGTKGARITSYISLPGRYLVLMPTSTHIGISRRIEDESERSRLKEMVADLRDDHLGYIVRTAAEGVQAEKFIQEMDFLKNAPFFPGPFSVISHSGKTSFYIVFSKCFTARMSRIVYAKAGRPVLLFGFFSIVFLHPCRSPLEMIFSL